VSKTAVNFPKYNLMWFRSDLRVYDNPALFTAMSQGPTLAVFMMTEGQWRRHGISPAKRSLILRQLQSLHSELEKLHVPLLVLACDDFKSVPATLLNLTGRYAIRSVFFNHEYEVNERACACEVEEVFQKQGIAVTASHDACLIPPGTIRNKQGEPYRVFTAFKRALFEIFPYRARAICNRPAAQRPVNISSETRLLEGHEACLETLWPAGEDEAHERLNQFMDSRVRHYKNLRDFPAAEATSVISPYLAVGALSTTQCMQAALSMNKGSLSEGHPGISCWINEIIWREFYRHLLVDFPDICRYKAFKPETDRLPWKQDVQLLSAWKEGRTGYPLVDAAMRQLNQTAWMHNRLRMVTAMFLSKHLFLDWRLGEAYFMSKLVDGDLASNNGGWQWSASTGVDAAPYFRIFNPVTQSQRFDPEGHFIRQYLPELRHLDNASIHMPTAIQARQAGYPLPIVEHAQAVAQTKHWFKSLSEPDTGADLFSAIEECDLPYANKEQQTV
jgi:deoxyribodipyrimidine photo-lyase